MMTVFSESLCDDIFTGQKLTYDSTTINVMTVYPESLSDDIYYWAETETIVDHST